LLPDCTTHTKYLKEIKSKKESQQKSNKKEYVDAYVSMVAPIKKIIEEESQNSVSTVSPRLIFIDRRESNSANYCHR
jgi:hypothetical protein